MKKYMPIDNKIHHLEIYSIGWGSIVITDKTQLSNLIKRELLSQKTCRNKYHYQSILATTTIFVFIKIYASMRIKKTASKGS
ncbi:hypothetical protein DEO72_LG1g2487 [Vigna unguiculata]|uniref:Uncharacterized protein n=1 Tax=Vigna unguiculata TaxID=3917 RepID=A0A4D6KWJ9_VIGUN|nr:hypothetical protein DEO72_LG1g2487 [Vigna unguiculata]